MARWNDLPWRDDVYKAAELWKAQCLVNDGSLTGESEVWTLHNLQELQARIVCKADWTKDTFWNKLFRQLDGANKDVIHLASEVIWLIYMFPLGDQAGDVPAAIKAKTKFQQVKKVRSFAALPAPTGPAFTQSALSGIGRIGRFYRRYFHGIRYLLEILIWFKQLPPAERSELTTPEGAWDFAEHSDLFQQETHVPMRHALMFLLFPESFERMVSVSHKKEIVRDLAAELSLQQANSFFDKGGFTSLLAIDQAVLNIRKSLAIKHRNNDLDFYREPIDGTWGMIKDPHFPNRAQMIGALRAGR